MTLVRRLKTIESLIIEEIRANPHVRAEQIWRLLQEKYPDVHFAWGYVRRIKTKAKGSFQTIERTKP